MDTNIQEFQFLDLEDTNEKERNHLHQVLFSQTAGKSPEFPWQNNEDSCSVKGWTSPNYAVNGPPDLVMPVADQEIQELSPQYAAQAPIPISHLPQAPGYAHNPESPNHGIVIPPPPTTSVPPPAAGPAPMYPVSQMGTPLSNVSNVYVGNVSANVSLHPYQTMPPPPAGYHHHHHNRHQSPLGSPHYSVEVDPNVPVEGSGNSSHRGSIGSQGSDRSRRIRSKGKRDEHHNVPSPESLPTVPQAYIHTPHTPFLTYAPYQYYAHQPPPPTQNNMATAQNVTGTPLYLAPTMQMYATAPVYGAYVPAALTHPHHHHHQSPGTQQEIQSQPPEHFQQSEEQPVIEHDIESSPMQQHYEEVDLHCQEQVERQPVVDLKKEPVYEVASHSPPAQEDPVDVSSEAGEVFMVPASVSQGEAEVIKTEHRLRTPEQPVVIPECRVPQPQPTPAESTPLIATPQTQSVPVMARTVQTQGEQQNAPAVVPEESILPKAAPPLEEGIIEAISPRTSMSPATSPTFPTETNTSSPETPVSVPIQTPFQEPSRTWASLFKGTQVANSHQSPVITSGDGHGGPKPLTRIGPFVPVDESCSTVPSVGQLPRSSAMGDDPVLYRLGEHLLRYELQYSMTPLQPRGLTNRSNWCYVNATLQALLACPPFYNLIKSLPMSTDRANSSKSPTPIITAMVELVKEFEPLPNTFMGLFGRMPRKDKVQRSRAGVADDANSPANTVQDVPVGPPFEPSYIYRMMNGIRGGDAFKVEGRQEDAEEFLGCLLNGLNDEMVELMKLVEDPPKPQGLTNGEVAPVDPVTPVPEPENADGYEWKLMGPKNKGSVTRLANMDRTPLSDIFRGQLRSRVQRMGDASTDNIQPFFTLQLDIEKAHSVKNAMELLVGKDQLEGLTCLRTNREVEAWQQVTIEELPPVLILHLKWFDYKLDACSKIVKSVEFTVDLKVDGKLLSFTKSKLALKQKQYKLFAVVYHDGNEATKGHYITDAYHQGLGGWIRYDDSTVRSISEAAVLKPKTPRVPYLLYYRRADTIGRGATLPLFTASEKPR